MIKSRELLPYSLFHRKNLQEWQNIVYRTVLRNILAIERLEDYGYYKWYGRLGYWGRGLSIFWEEEFTFVSTGGYKFWSGIEQAGFVGCGDEIFLLKEEVAALWSLSVRFRQFQDFTYFLRDSFVFLSCQMRLLNSVLFCLFLSKNTWPVTRVMCI